MSERLLPQGPDPGTGDLAVVRFYGLSEESTKGMREWLGVPGSADPIDPQHLAQAAKDTEAYLLSRPAEPEDQSSPDSHYEATLGQDDPTRKTARQLVEEWAEADLADDQTRAADISEVLADRALRRAALVKDSRASDQLVDAAYALDALYDRKERLKRQRLESGAPDDSNREKIVAQKASPPSVKTGKQNAGDAAKPKPPPAAIALPVPPPRPAAPESPQEAPSGQEAKSSAKPPRRIGNPLRYVGAAIATWLSDPEKGRRRQALVTLGGFLVAGAAGWLLGHQWHEHAHQPPPDMAVPPPPDTGPPPHDTCAPQCPDSPTQHYNGQQYEWNAAADNYGAANATPRLLNMIDDARARGAQVSTWGDPASGHWGINDITVHSRGGQETYYDTQRKWAILEHLSRLHRLTDDDQDEVFN